MWLYLAGPYSPFEESGVEMSIQQNVDRTAILAAECYDAGHVPIAPHLLTRAPSEHTKADELDHEYWLDRTRDMQRRCDATLLLPYWKKSEGARQEKAYAEEVGMPVFEYSHSDGPPPLHPTEQKSPVQVEAFIERLMKMHRTHLSKNADYSPANILGTGEVGVVVRLWDKVARLLNLYGFDIQVEAPAEFEEPSDPEHESIDDTLLDTATYGVIGKLLREGKWGR